MNIESDQYQDNVDIRVSSEQKNKIYNRRKLMSFGEEIDNQLITCVCCLHELFTYVYYACSHFVCLNCSAKMRILCEKLDCPICRSISSKVFCTKKPIDFLNFDMNLLTDENLATILNKEAGIFCDRNNNIIKSEFDEILCNRCDICPKNLAPFRSFKDLNIHIKKVHRRFYCDLCLENLQLFTYERKHYTREELASHKRNGDLDDFSFKGHPLCEYCDVRYFDKDELYRHFRKDHYYCHFCDSDGIEEYYKDYNQLRRHFLEKHYLCEMDNCSANASETHEYVVFRTELDFQVHKKQKHAKTKLEQKNLGKLNIEFNLTNSARDKYKRSNNSRNNYSEGSALKPKEKKKYQNSMSSNKSSKISDNDEFKNQDEKDSFKTNRMNDEKQSKLLESCLADCSIETSVKKESASNNLSNLIKLNDSIEISEDDDFPSLIPKENKKNKSLIQSEISNENLNGFGLNYSKISHKNQQYNALKEKQYFDEDFPSIIGTKSDISKIENKSSEKIKRSEDDFPSLITKENKKNKSLIQSEISNENLNGFGLNYSKISHKNQQYNALKEKQYFDEDFPSIIETKSDVSKIENTSSEKINISQSEEKFLGKSMKNFIKPNNYDQRNKDIETRIFRLFQNFSDNEFQTFKNYSNDFRDDLINASDYLLRSQNLLNLPTSLNAIKKNKNLEKTNLHVQFLNLIQEMLVLLPNVEKQNELFIVLAPLIDKLKHNISKSHLPNTKSKWGTQDDLLTFSMNLSKCSFCNQYFSDTEIDSHQKKYHTEQLTSKTNPDERFQEPRVSKSEPFQQAYIKNATSRQFINENDFPMLTNSSIKTEAPVWTVKPTEQEEMCRKQINQKKAFDFNEDFPALESNSINNQENRISSLPTVAIFQNPSSHLSLLNKKKYRFKR